MLTLIDRLSGSRMHVAVLHNSLREARDAIDPVIFDGRQGFRERLDGALAQSEDAAATLVADMKRLATNVAESAPNGSPMCLLSAKILAALAPVTD